MRRVVADFIRIGKTSYNRFMKSYFKMTCCVLCFALMLALAACDALRPIPVKDDTVEVEVAIFEGGYGINWHQKIADEYNEIHKEEGVRVKLWGDPRVSEKIKPRLLRGDPPDVLLLHRMPFWRLIEAGKLLPFNGALQLPAPGGGDAPWEKLFQKGTLQAFSHEGNVYAIPSAFGAWACWYDARLFRENGWETPTTWDGFEDLCKQIIEDGYAPIAYQGKYPLYGWWTFISLMHRCGGLAAINRINALEQGAFSHPDIIKAAALMQRMSTGYFQKGALAMTHIDSQLQFVNNKAAMIFCGMWLYNEMKDSIPPEFEMRAFNVPAVSGGKGNPALFNGRGQEFIFVPADTKHPEEAFDFVRFMVSPKNAPDQGASIGVISPLKNATPKDAMPPPLQSALDMINSSEGIFHVFLEDLLLEWRSQVMEPMMAALLRGEVSPEEFCAALNAGIEVAKSDPESFIPIMPPYNPAEYGETP